jgi:phosphatidylglycerol phospholipase C
VAGDGVVVITHDENTMRCFGVDYDVTKTPYFGVLDQLKALDVRSQNARNEADPTNTTPVYSEEHMPTFQQVVDKFAKEPEYSKIQLMLDIKRNNEPWVISKIVEVLRNANPDLEGFWADRFVLGIWRWDVLEEAAKVCPELPVLHIGVSRSLARKFMTHPQVIGISLNHICLNVSGGEQLVKDAHEKGIVVHSWTINTVPVMQWAISSNLDGIITDYPDEYHKLINSVSQEDIDSVYSVKEPWSFHSFRARVAYRFQFLLMWFRVKYFDVTFLFSPVRKPPQ